MKRITMSKLSFIIALLVCGLLSSCWLLETTTSSTVDRPTTNNGPSNNTAKATDAAVEVGLCPDVNHPHAIDLGIGLKWSCCNVGASAPWDNGNWYAWGETTSKTKFYYNTYSHSSSGGYADLGASISGTRYDAATMVQGRKWRMPTAEEYEQLLNCTTVWGNLNGVKGFVVQGPNENGIFFPAAGYGWDESLKDNGTRGHYWTASQSPYGIASAMYVEMNSSGNANIKYYNRAEGRTIRAVAQ